MSRELNQNTYQMIEFTFNVQCIIKIKKRNSAPSKKLKYRLNFKEGSICLDIKLNAVHQYMKLIKLVPFCLFSVFNFNLIVSLENEVCVFMQTKTKTKAIYECFRVLHSIQLR